MDAADMSERLTALIAKAVVLAGGDLCAEGHDWVTEGGRSCPEDLRSDCGQAVYRCARCGEYDYGHKGGPGWTDCQRCAYRSEEPA